MLSRKEFDKKFREALWKMYPERMASGKIRETPTEWIGISFKKKGL